MYTKIYQTYRNKAKHKYLPIYYLCILLTLPALHGYNIWKIIVQ